MVFLGANLVLFAPCYSVRSAFSDRHGCESSHIWEIYTTTCQYNGPVAFPCFAKAVHQPDTCWSVSSRGSHNIITSRNLDEWNLGSIHNAVWWHIAMPALDSLFI